MRGTPHRAGGTPRPRTVFRVGWMVTCRTPPDLLGVTPSCTRAHLPPDSPQEFDGGKSAAANSLLQHTTGWQVPVPIPVRWAFPVRRNPRRFPQLRVGAARAGLCECALLQRRRLLPKEHKVCAGCAVVPLEPSQALCCSTELGSARCWRLCAPQQQAVVAQAVCCGLGASVG
jgi:hypothetical protein